MSALDTGITLKEITLKYNAYICKILEVVEWVMSYDKHSMFKQCL